MAASQQPFYSTLGPEATTAGTLIWSRKIGAMGQRIIKTKRKASPETRLRGDDGIRTPEEGFADPSLTTWPRRQ